MELLRRWFAWLGWLCVVIVILATAMLWYLGAAWVPTHGKQQLVQELRRRLHQEVTLRELSYRPGVGFTAQELVIRPPGAAQPTLAAQRVRLRIFWLALLARELRFRAAVQLADPGPATLTVRGSYHWRTTHTRLSIAGEAIEVAALNARTRAYLPPQLQDARLGGLVHARWSRTQPLALEGQLHLTDARLVHAPLTMTGDATLIGTAQYDPHGAPPWTYQATLLPKTMRLDGIPSLQRIEQIEGRLEITDTDISRLDLRGLVMDWPVTLSGTVKQWRAQPEADVRMHGAGEVAAWAALVPALGRDTAVTGMAEVTTRLQGRLGDAAHPPAVTAEGSFHDITLTTPRLPHPITKITGAASYAQATRTLLIRPTRGFYQDHPAQLQGQLSFQQVPTADLELSVEGDINEWAAFSRLPPAVTTLQGPASLTLHAQGPLTALARSGYQGTLLCRDVTLKLAALPEPIQHLQGPIQITAQRLNTAGLALVYRGQPYELAGSMGLASPQAVQATLRGPWFSTTAQLVIGPAATEITEWVCRSGRTMLRLTGTLTHAAAPALEVSLDGTVYLDDAAQLPDSPLKRALMNADARGEVRVAGDASCQPAQWQRGTYALTLQSPRLTWQQYQMERVSATVEARAGRLVLVGAEGSLYGGMVQGQGEWDASTPDPPSWRLTGDLMQLHLEQLPRAEGAASMDGALSGHVELAGRSGAPEGITGVGWARAQGTNLGTLTALRPMTGGLLSLLADYFKLSELRQVTLTQAGGHFTVKDRRLWSDDVALGGTVAPELPGTPVAFAMQGSVGFDQTVDFIVQPSIAETVLQSSPVVVPMVERLRRLNRLVQLGNAFGKIRITGTLKKPAIKPELLPMREVLRNLMPTLDDVLDFLP